MRYSFFVGAAVALFFAAATAQAQAPTGNDFVRLPSGTEARFFRKDASGRYQPRPAAVATDAPYSARTGQVLTVFMEFRTGRDSVLMKSRLMQPVAQPVALPPNPTRGSLEDALTTLLPGDSAVFRFQADTVFTKTFRQPVPPFVRKSGNVLLVYTSAQELLTMAEMTARQEKMRLEYVKQAEAQAAAQASKDEAQIQAYLKKNKLVAKKTAGGTYYVITKPSKGALPTNGQTVRVLYRGTVLATGQEFDSSAKHGNVPIAFPLGAGQVIKGWDQGIAMLPKGSKAILLIPSALAYGPRGAGADIPGNAPLRFDVELVDFK